MEKRESAKAGKTVLLVDDEQTFLEPLADALLYEGHQVLKARTVEEGLRMLATERIDLVTIDVMMPAGASLEAKVGSHTAGLYLCEKVHELYPNLDAFCISVLSDYETIREIEALGIRFLRKGETPLRTVLNMLRSRLTGIAYSTERDKRGR